MRVFVCWNRQSSSSSICYNGDIQLFIFLLLYCKIVLIDPRAVMMWQWLHRLRQQWQQLQRLQRQLPTF